MVGRVYAGWIPLCFRPSGESHSILVSAALTLADVMEWGHFGSDQGQSRRLCGHHITLVSATQSAVQHGRHARHTLLYLEPVRV